MTLSLNGGTLTPNQSNPNVWNWVDCNNNYQVIAGANGNSYTPTVSGNYAAVFTTSFNCYIYSECVNVQVLGLNETEYNSISLSPNPSSNFIQINNGIDKNVEVLSIKNSLGQEQSFHMNNSNQIDISNFPIGIYIVEVSDYQQLKFIKK